MASTKDDVGSDDENYRDRETEESWEPNKHPLLIDAVLRTLFEFMGGEDLKVCRLVSKKWCELTLPFTRSKFKVKLNENGEDNTRSVTDFVEVFRQNTFGIPFDKYDLDPFCTREGPGQEFLRICGNTAKRVTLNGPKVEDVSEVLKSMLNIEFLRFSGCSHSRSGNVVKLFPDDTSTKPTLTRLKEISFYDFDRQAVNDVNEYCPTLFEEIFSIAPNISYIEVEKYSNENIVLVPLLKAIEKCGRESVITAMGISRIRTDHVELLQRLAENGLKLKKFNFTTCREDFEGLIFLPSLATLFKNSIEILYVEETCPSFSQLPIMPKLKSLGLDILKGFDSKSVNLNKLCPSLKELKLYYFDPDEDDEYEWEWEEFLPNSEPCPNLKSLYLHLLDLPMRIQAFDNILNIFPKLTKLEFDLEVGRHGVQILRKIMGQMTQLEDLSVSTTIEGTENIDALLTGIPVQRVEELKHVVTGLKEMTVQLRAEVIRHYTTQYSQFPSIANLTNLKRLELTLMGANECDGQLTDIFAYFGLYSMKHINELRIYRCELTKTTCEILTAEMGLKAWYFSGSGGDIIIPRFY